MHQPLCGRHSWPFISVLQLRDLVALACGGKDDGGGPWKQEVHF